MTSPAADESLPRDGAIADYRNLASVIIGLALMQAAVAALTMIVPLALADRGAGPFGIGVAAAGYALGFLTGALRATAAVRTIGHIRTFAAMAALAAIAVLMLFAFQLLVVWTLLQVLIGFCVSSLLTAGESWVAASAPQERRGGLLAFYMLVSKLGQIAGPVLLATLAPGSASGFMAVAALFTASLIPVCATRRAQPPAPANEPFGVVHLWRVAPAAVAAAFAAGAVNGAVLQLYALFAVNRAGDFGPGAAAAFNAAIALGAVALQWPAGWWSDRRDRRIVIAWLAIIGALASLALAFAADRLPWAGVLLLAAVWGAGSLSFYGVAVAHAADRAPAGQTASMMAGILVVWALGALAGPLIAGVVMSTGLGTSGLFAYAAAGLVALTVAMLARRAQTAPTDPDAKSAFAIAPATSMSVTLIDPRSAEAPETAESTTTTGEPLP